MQLAAQAPGRDSGSRRIRSSVLVALISLVALLALIPAGRAAAVENGSYGIRPATEADFLNLSVAPGAAVDAVAIVSNSTSAPVTFRTYPVDASSDANGFAMQDEGAPRTGVGAWVQFEGQELTVPAESEAELPLRLSVPAGTQPGDYAGAIIIEAPPEEGETTELEDGTAVRLDVVQRLGLRIYLDVAGEAVLGLEPGELEVERGEGALTITLPITNTGNTNLDPRVDVVIDGWPGDPRQFTMEGTEDLLTGSTHTLEKQVEDMPPLFIGSAAATVVSEAGEEQVSESIVYVEWPLLVGALIVLIVLALIAWRVIAFVRRARRALAEVEGRRGRRGRRAR